MTSEMPERIYARKSQYWSRHLEDTDVTEYVRADLHRKALDRIAFLEKGFAELRKYADIRHYFFYESDAQDPDAMRLEIQLEAGLVDVGILSKCLEKKEGENG